MPTRHPRLDQLFSQLGYGSRRQCEFWIKDGRVTVDGESKPKVNMRVDPSRVRVDGEGLDHPEGLVLLLNKPVGYSCTHAEDEGPTVYSFLPPRWRLRCPQVVSVGRLDKDTSGLLLLTDRHEWVQACASPRRHLTKVYEFEFEGTLDPMELEKMALGQLILRRETKPCLPARLVVIAPGRGRLELREGRYHQVRRMVAACGGHVLSLHRSHFGTLDLSGLSPGEYRLLDPTPESLERV